MRANHESILREQQRSLDVFVTFNDCSFVPKRTDGARHHFGCQWRAELKKLSLLILAFSGMKYETQKKRIRTTRGFVVD